MGISNSEMERLADDLYHDRRITSTVHCGNCGYNLKTLPYAYHCPECGSAYNARPLQLRGIYRHHDETVPFGDMFLTLFFGAGTVFMAFWVGNPPALASLVVFCVLLIMTLLVASRAYQRMKRFLKARAIEQRIREEEASE